MSNYIGAEVSRQARGFATDEQLAAHPKRNRLINGDFNIWQRGDSVIGSGYKNADRWHLPSNDMSLAKVASGDSDFQFSNYAALSRDGVLTTRYMGQTIELPRGGFAGEFGIGQEFILSGWLRPDEDGAFWMETAFVDVWNDTTNNVTDYTSDGSITIPAGVGWVYFEVPFTVGVAPAGTSFAYRVRFGVQNMPTNTSKLLYADIQLTPGRVVTKFERRSMADQWDLCLRYYQKHVIQSFSPVGVVRTTAALNALGAHMMRTTSMRTTPTVTTNGASITLISLTDETQTIIGAAVYSPLSNFGLQMNTPGGANGKSYMALPTQGLEIYSDAEL